MVDPTRSNAPAMGSWKQAGWYSLVLLIGFLLGSVPLWLRMQSEIVEKESFQWKARLLEIQNELASSLIHSNRNQHEEALQEMSRFFTELNRELTDPSKSRFNAQQFEKIRSILLQRDETIAMLARKDPNSSERLLKIYDQFSGVLEKSLPRHEKQPSSPPPPSS